MFSISHTLSIYNKTCVASANLRWNICENRIESWTFLDLVCGYRKCLFIDILNGCIGPLPIVITIESRVVIDIWRHSSISLLNRLLYDVWSLVHTTPQNHSNLGTRLRKSSHLGPTHLPTYLMKPLDRIWWNRAILAAKTLRVWASLALNPAPSVKWSLMATSHMRLRAPDTSHYAWGTNGLCECKMDVKSTWIRTRHQMDHVSWSLGLCSQTTSWR